MVRWDKFVFSDFEFDENIEEKLHLHGIRFYEAVECFYNPFRYEETNNLEIDSN